MSRAFHFALQPILQHYETMERYARTELEIARRRLDDATLGVQRLRADLGAAVGAWVQHYDDRSLFYAHVEYMHSAIHQQGTSISSCAVELDRTRRSLIAATRKRRALEQLKTRRADAHLLREQWSEQRELDESNLCVYESVWRGHSWRQMPRSRNIRGDKWT